MKLGEVNDEHRIKIEIVCLSTCELENFEILLEMTIWYEIFILFTLNSISKNFQSKIMHINVDIEQLNDLVTFFEKYL